MSFLSRAFGTPEERVLTGSSFVPTPAEDDAMYPWGSNSYSVTPRGARETQVAAFTACVTLLADTIASLGLTAYQLEGGIPVPVDPQPKLVMNPYPETTLFEWIWMTMEALTVTGNGFGYITARNPDDTPKAIMPVHPDFMTVNVAAKNGWMEPTYLVDGTKVPSADVVHIKRYPVAGAALGLSPVQRAAAAVGIALAAERYGLNYFKDSANPSSVLETDQTLDTDQTKGVMQRWIASHSGRRRPAILTGGLKWKPIAISPEESQFLETRRYQRGEIAMLFRIPPHMIGDTEKSTSWGTGIEQQTLGFVKFTLRAWLTCIEQALSLLLPKGQYVKFTLDDLLRGDMKSRFEAYKIGREMGLYDVNEIRAKEDLGPVENGDVRLQPMNYAPLGSVPTTNSAPAGQPEAEETPEEEPAAEPDEDEGDPGQEDQ